LINLGILFFLVICFFGFVEKSKVLAHTLLDFAQKLKIAIFEFEGVPLALLVISNDQI